jgi:hypothetical protein
MSGPTQGELNRDAIRQGVRVRADQIKQKLFRWISQKGGPDDAVPMTIALLEIAIEGHLVMTENENDTLDFITKTFHRIVHKPSGRLQ